MKRATLLALLFLCLSSAFVFANEQQLNCNYAYVQNLISTLNETVTKFDSTSNVYRNFVTGGTNWAATYIGLATSLLPCYIAMGLMGAGSAKVTVDANSNYCFLSQNDAAWKTDPCCNIELQNTQCCAMRKVTFSRDIFTDLNAAAQKACSNPSKVKETFFNFLKAKAKNELACRAGFETRLQETQNTVLGVYQCLQDFAAASVNCRSDSDCTSGKCNLFTRTCSAAGYTVDKTNTGLAKCIASKVSAYTLRGIQFALALRGSSGTLPTVEEFSDKLLDSISTPRCVNSFGVVQDTITNQADCEKVQACTDRLQGSCSDANSFCGVACDGFGFCPVSLAGLVNNEQTCTQVGRCYANMKEVTGTVFGQLWNKADCEAQSNCLGAANGCTTCQTDKATCEASGKCLGFPVPFDNTLSQVCVFASANAFSCPLGFTFNHIAQACISLTLSGAACTSAGASMISVPSTKTECEQYKWCKETNQKITYKSEAECTKCGGTTVNRYVWVPATYQPRTFVPIGTWTKREMKQRYKWVPTLDSVKFQAFVEKSLDFHFKNLLKSVFLCNYGPVVELTRRISCDCASDKPSGVDCFATPVTSNIGSLTAYSGVSSRFELVDVTVTVAANSSFGSQDISIIKTELNAAVQVQAARRSINGVLQNPSSNYVVMYEGQNVGRVCGSGYALSQSTANPVTFCINRDPELGVDTTTYPQPAFAIKNNAGQFIVTSVPITNVGQTDAQICGSVSDTRTYYPAFVKPGKYSSASGIKASVLMVLIALVLQAAALLF